MVGHSSPSPLNNAALAPLLDLALICPPTPVPPKTEQDILEAEESEQRSVVNTSGRKSRFFLRSASTFSTCVDRHRTPFWRPSTRSYR